MSDVKIPGGDRPPEGPVGAIFKGDFGEVLEMVHPWAERSPDASERTVHVLADVRRFLSLPCADAESIEKNKEVPLEALEKMAEIGLFALKVPERLGGKGLDCYGYNKILSLLGSRSSAFPAYVSAHNSLGAVYPLLYYGTEEQKKRLLPEIIRWPTGFCFTEREVGSDPGSMRAYAVRVKDGRGNTIGYLLNAKKWYTTNALRAKHLAVVAKAVDNPPEENELPGGGDFCVFIVSTSSDGVNIGSPNEFAGMFGIDNANPEFNNVFVPVENRVGKEGQGFNIALEALNTGRIAVAALSVTAMKQSLAVSRWWAGTRNQMGVIGRKHELIQEKLVKMAAETYAMESLVDYCAIRADEGLDAGVEAALSKAVTTEVGWRCVDDMMQIRGGRGYETHKSLSPREAAPPVERIWRDFRVARIFEGTTEVLTLWSAARGMYPYIQVSKKTKNGPIGMASAGKDLLAMHVSSRKPFRIDFESFPENLHHHLKYAEKASRRLVRLIIAQSVKNREKMQYKQVLVKRLFMIVARILTITLSISRAVHEGTKEELELVDVYSKIARTEIESLFEEVKNNTDSLNHLTANDILDGKYSFIEDGIENPILTEE